MYVCVCVSDSFCVCVCVRVCVLQGAEDDEDGAPAKALTHMTSVHKRAIVLKKGDVVRVKSGQHTSAYVMRASLIHVIPLTKPHT